MRIRELDGGLTIAPPSGTRTGSPAHVSNIIRDIENTCLKPGQRRPYDELSPNEKKRLGNYASMGWAWEEIVRRGILDAGWNPASDQDGIDRYMPTGELNLQGIYGTPDWLDTVDYAVVEFKATWRSANRPLDPDFWHWIVQVKSYCKLLATTRAKLLVFYVNGNYRESGPFLREYELLFTELELDENWRMLHGHAKSKGWVK